MKVLVVLCKLGMYLFLAYQSVDSAAFVKIGCSAGRVVNETWDVKPGCKSCSCKTQLYYGNVESCVGCGVIAGPTTQDLSLPHPDCCPQPAK